MSSSAACCAAGGPASASCGPLLAASAITSRKEQSGCRTVMVTAWALAAAAADVADAMEG
jgi:hypothetical protein